MEARLAIEKAKERLANSVRPVALTGAGVSAESGVPTFRGQEGLWRNFNPQDLATLEAFSKDPSLVWEWYDWRRSLIKKVRPNPGHFALVEIERKKKDFVLITQNVDGLHKRAGSKKVLELHGSIWRVKCLKCGESRNNEDVPISILPYCGCGGLLRPGVVWFKETLPEDVLKEAFSAVQKADFILVAGTSGVVQPAASLAISAKRQGAFLVEINPQDTPLTEVADISITGKSGEILPSLV